MKAKTNGLLISGRFLRSRLAPAGTPPVAVAVPSPVANGARGGQRARRWLGAAATVAALALLIALWQQADGPLVRGLLDRVGARLPLLLPCFAAAMLAATAAWRFTLLGLGQRAPMPTLLRLRVGAEAVVLSVPGGALLSDVLRPRWLSRHGVALPEATASVALGRALVIAASGLFVALALILAPRSIAQVYAALGLSALGPWPHLLLALALTGLGAGLAIALMRGDLAARALALLARLPLPRVRALPSSRGTAARVDGALRALRVPAARGALALALGASLGQWLLEALETFVLLSLLGVEVSWSTALAIESLVAMVRTAAFVVPAGLGAQDLALAFVLHALGVPGGLEVAVAFVVVKRARELLWVALGYGGLLLGRAPR